MSLIGILKVLSKAVAIAEPHVVNLIDFKRALAVSESENKRLLAENKSLKTKFTITTILSIAFFVAFLVVLTLLLTK